MQSTHIRFMADAIIGNLRSLMAFMRAHYGGYPVKQLPKDGVYKCGKYRNPIVKGRYCNPNSSRGKHEPWGNHRQRRR